MRKRTTTRAITAIGALLSAGLLASQAGARIPGLELLEAERTDPLPVVAPPPVTATVVDVRPVPHAVEDWAEQNDYFGRALASGDFNGDGHPDLAIGVLGEDSSAGAVNVLYGTADGLESVLSAEDNQLWHAGNVDLTDNHRGFSLQRAPYQSFGRALAAGDMTGDGYDDLAIGVPGAHVEGYRGVVVLLLGSEHGLQAQGALLYGLHSPCRVNGYYLSDFGSALAMGDFDGDGYGDLVVGDPKAVFCDLDGDGYGDLAVGDRATVYGDQTGGRVHVYRGWSDVGGIASHRTYSFGQDYEFLPSGVGRLDLLGDGEQGDGFGRALAVGDFDGDGYDDLAIGVPGDNSKGTILDAGMVHAVYGSPDGLGGADDQSFQNGWYEETARSSAGVEAGDRFGRALAVGDFDGDGFHDLAIGLPGEDIGGTVDAGAVEVLYGGSSGLDKRGSQFWGGCCALERGYHAGDRLGSSLAAGDFDGDGCDDLAAGRPSASFGGVSRTGLVSVIYGYASFGLHWGDNFYYTAPYAGAAGSLQPEERFGTALAALHTWGDSQLAIGIPYRDIGSAYNAGTVVVPHRRPTEFDRGREWSQESSSW